MGKGTTLVLFASLTNSFGGKPLIFFSSFQSLNGRDVNISVLIGITCVTDVPVRESERVRE